MPLGSHSNNYTLGKGEIYFDRFAEGTETPTGERYFGNTPEFTMTIEEEALDHFSSDEGIREKDDSVSLEVTRSGTLVTDNINPENVALFFFGTASVKAEGAATVADEALDGVQQGLYYQLGVSSSSPAGVRGLTVHTAGPPDQNIIVTSSDGMTTYDETDDYLVDMDLARIYIVPGGAIADDTDILVDYKVAAKSRKQVISGSTAIQGALRFVAVNPKGEQFDYFFPKVKLSPNGDYSLKGEEWQQVPLNIEILKKTGLEAIYMDGRPYTPA